RDPEPRAALVHRRGGGPDRRPAGPSGPAGQSAYLSPAGARPGRGLRGGAAPRGRPLPGPAPDAPAGVSPGRRVGAGHGGEAVYSRGVRGGGGTVPPAVPQAPGALPGPHSRTPGAPPGPARRGRVRRAGPDREDGSPG